METEKLKRLAVILMQVVARQISTGKAREILREEWFPEEVIHLVMAPPTDALLDGLESKL